MEFLEIVQVILKIIISVIAIYSFFYVRKHEKDIRTHQTEILNIKNEIHNHITQSVDQKTQVSLSGNAFYASPTSIKVHD